MEWAGILVQGLGVYLGIGVLFALFFLTGAVGWFDPAAKGTSIGFRLIIFPGVVALWPIVLEKWLLVRKKRAGD